MSEDRRRPSPPVSVSTQLHWRCWALKKRQLTRRTPLFSWQGITRHFNCLWSSFTLTTTSCQQKVVHLISVIGVVFSILFHVFVREPTHVQTMQYRETLGSDHFGGQRATIFRERAGSCYSVNVAEFGSNKNISKIDKIIINKQSQREQGFTSGTRRRSRVEHWTQQSEDMVRLAQVNQFLENVSHIHDVPALCQHHSSLYSPVFTGKP